jgi:hypothetical protein
MSPESLVDRTSGQYNADGNCRACGKPVDAGAQGMHLRNCVADRTPEAAAATHMKRPSGVPQTTSSQAPASPQEDDLDSFPYFGETAEAGARTRHRDFRVEPGPNRPAQQDQPGRAAHTPVPVVPPSVPAGWLTDPNNPEQLRLWDGLRWTRHTSPFDAAPPLVPASGSAELQVPIAPDTPGPYNQDGSCRRCGKPVDLRARVMHQRHCLAESRPDRPAVVRVRRPVHREAGAVRRRPELRQVRDG